MWFIEQLAETRILEAIKRGELDNLPGAGKPLCLDDDAMVPEELRMAYRVLKNAGCLPPELELRQEVQALEAQLGGIEDQEGRRRALKRLSCLLMRLEAASHQRLNLLVQQQYYDKIVQRLAGIKAQEQKSEPSV